MGVPLVTGLDVTLPPGVISDVCSTRFLAGHVTFSTAVRGPPFLSVYQVLHGLHISSPTPGPQVSDPATPLLSVSLPKALLHKDQGF